MVFRLIFLLIVAVACTGPRGAHSGGATKFPPRPPTCDLAMIHAPTPGVQAWDDLGVAEITCHINIGLPQCMRQFRAEACRMGGDIVYQMPEKPLRPREQAVVYRGRVAHTRPASPGIQRPRNNQAQTGATPQPPAAVTPQAAAKESPSAATVDPPPADAGAGVDVKGGPVAKPVGDGSAV